MSTATNPRLLRLALPKGRMQDGVLRLLREAGVSITLGARTYRPTTSLPDLDAKMLKPRNIVEMLDVGRRDVGLVGADLVAERGAALVEVLDTGLDPVQIVAAAPPAICPDGVLLDRPLLIATEYEQLAAAWVRAQGRDDRLVRSYGSTEVFPPEDADLIIDNTATGATLAANGLRIVDVLMRSTTRLYASQEAWGCPQRRTRIEDLSLLLSSVLEARRRVMVEINVGASQLDGLVAVLPCLRQPTVAPLHGGSGFAVKAAVPRAELAAVLPRIKQRGGTDIVVSAITQLVP